MDQELKPLPVNIHNFGDLRLAQSWHVNPEALQQRIEAQQQGLSIELCHHYQNNSYSKQHLSALLTLGLISRPHTERYVNQCSFPNLEMERCYQQLFPAPVPPRVTEVN